jgi:hypothetical protein
MQLKHLLPMQHQMQRTMLVCLLAMPVWPEMFWYAKLLGIQYIADPYFQIIEGPGPSRMDAYVRLPSSSHPTGKKLAVKTKKMRW